MLFAWNTLTRIPESSEGGDLRNFGSQSSFLRKSEALIILTVLYCPRSRKSLSPLKMQSTDAERAHEMNLSSPGSLHTPLTLLITSMTSKYGRISCSMTDLI